MGTWSTDEELFAIAEQNLSTCVVGDIMDQMGLYHQYLPPQIRPLSNNMILIGRAMTVLAGDVFQESVTGSANGLMQKPFGLMFQALDDLRPNEIYVSTGASPRNASWGEMMATRARFLGARGAVLNGYYRDTRGLQRMNFPTFGFGSYGQDSGPRYKVHDFRVPIEIGGVSIRSGDILFGDIDGVCVIPTSVEHEVFARAIEKIHKENVVKRDLESGVSAASAYEVHQVM